MMILGIILVVLGWLLGFGLLVTIGLILLVIGAVLMIFDATGRPVGGRRWY